VNEWLHHLVTRLYVVDMHRPHCSPILSCTHRPTSEQICASNIHIAHQPRPYIGARRTRLSYTLLVFAVPKSPSRVTHLPRRPKHLSSIITLVHYNMPGHLCLRNARCAVCHETLFGKKDDRGRVLSTSVTRCGTSPPRCRINR